MFKLNDRVFDYTFGWGAVIESESYVVVKFDVGYTETYDFEGKLYPSCQRTLFHQEMKLFSKEDFVETLMQIFHQEKLKLFRVE